MIFEDEEDCLALRPEKATALWVEFNQAYIMISVWIKMMLGKSLKNTWIIILMKDPKRHLERYPPVPMTKL